MYEELEPNASNLPDAESLDIAAGLWLLRDRERKITDMDDEFSAALSMAIQTKLAEKYGAIH